MRQLLALFALACILASAPTASAQWSQNYDDYIWSPSLSLDGKYLAVTTDHSTLDVYDAVAGKKLWSRKLEVFNGLFTTMFTNDGTLMLGADKSFYFLDPATGNEVSKLPIYGGDDWKDLEIQTTFKDPEMDTLKPYFMGDVGIFYFDDGINIIDLEKRSLIHAAEASPSAVKYQTWDHLLLVKLDGTDTMYIIDTKAKRIALQFDAYYAQPNSSIYQHMLVHNDQMLFMAEDNMLSFDLKTGKRTSILDIDPDDPDVYVPVNAKDAFYLMVSEDHKQRLYDVKSGAQLWETKPDVIPGAVEQVNLLGEKEAVIHTYHDDGKIGLYRLSLKDGSVLWSQIVAEQDGDYVSGHKKASKTMAVVAAVATQILAQALRGPARVSMADRSSGNYNMSAAMMDDWDRRRFQAEDRERWGAFMNSINRKQSSEGYAKVLEVNDKSITLLLVGKLYNTIKKSEQKDYDGEGILVLDSKTGVVLKQENFSISAKNTDIENVINNMKTERLGGAYVTVGYNTVCVVRGDQVEEIPFGTSALTYITHDDKSVVFMSNVDEEGDIFDYWQLDPKANPSKKTLIARSVEQNVVFQTPTPVTASFNLTDDEVQAFDPIVGEITANTFNSPKWKITDDELSTLDVGNLTKARSGLDSVNGVRVTSTGLYLLGTDKIGKISNDGKCRWALEWEPSLLMNHMGPTELGNTIVFSTGDDCQIMKNTCEGGSIGRHDIDHRMTNVMYSAKTERVIFIDRSDGIITSYPTK